MTALSGNCELIDVLGSGAVLLGPSVTCDGFHTDRSVRVQTHVHSDHMNEFTTSLRGDVLMTKPTRDLLHYDHPALKERPNVWALDHGEMWEQDGIRVQLFSSRHMLGSVQVKVILDDGVTVGYSGDFGWPLDKIMKVDALVVDATYGDPSSKDRCSQEQVQEVFVDLVRKKLRLGPVHLMANTGPLERALELLMMSDTLEGVPTIGKKRACASAEVNRKHGRFVPSLLRDGTDEAQVAIKGGSYVQVWSLNSSLPYDGMYEGTKIYLTKYRTGMEPYEESPENVFRVGLSNHADFLETLEYVEATGAKFVVTDNHRGNKSGRAEKLAKMLRAQLNIRARVSTCETSLLWGK